MQRVNARRVETNGTEAELVLQSGPRDPSLQILQTPRFFCSHVKQEEKHFVSHFNPVQLFSQPAVHVPLKELHVWFLQVPGHFSHNIPPSIETL